jgi:hypothetical protein
MAVEFGIENGLVAAMQHSTTNVVTSGIVTTTSLNVNTIAIDGVEYVYSPYANHWTTDTGASYIIRFSDNDASAIEGLNDGVGDDDDDEEEVREVYEDQDDEV